MPTFRTTDGAELIYEERGRGAPAVLFIHGWQGDRTLWRELIDALPGVHAVSVDLRGFGDSNAAAGPYDLERLSADLRELVANLGLAPVVAVGHSMGGTVALRFAVDAPDLLRALVLIAPVAASGGGFSPKGELFLRSTAGDPAAARAWLARTIMNPPDAATLDRLCAAAARASRDAVLESFASWAHADFAEATRAIAVPALVVAAEHDVPDAKERDVAALLPDARFVMLPDTAHYVNLERPNEVAKLIAEFVR